MNKAIIVPDKFKGSLSSIEVCNIIEKAIHNVKPKCQIVKIPISDGGDGCIDCFLYAFGGERQLTFTKGPFNDALSSHYAILHNKTAVIEMAATAGLVLAKDHLDPLNASTYGVGEQIKAAINNGAKKVIIGLGGSCTNDAGCGLAAALGVEFYNKDGDWFIPTGKNLQEISRIDTSNIFDKVAQTQIIVLCDVTNTFCGPSGAAYVFARQKGADEYDINVLDENMIKYSKLLKQEYNFDTDFEGAGAAGGTTVACKLFLNAQVMRGIDAILDLIDFDHELEDADVVFTGEGRFDFQSINGKVISGLAKRTYAHNVPLIAITGQIKDVKKEDYPHGLNEVVSLMKPGATLEEAIKDTPSNMQTVVEKICLSFISKKIS